MNYDRAFERFTLFSDMSAEEAAKWSYLVNDCIAEISEMLIPDSDNEENSRRIITATASLALYRYRKLLCARGDLSGIKAGDVTVSIDNKSVETARQLYIEALSDISDIIKKDEFIFGRTDSLCMKD